MILFNRILAAAVGVVFASLSHAEAPTESPITRIRADYLCSLGAGDEVVAFTLAAPGAPARVWLGMADNDMGLEPEVRAFTYGACAGCFALQARYSFSGGLNLLQLETVAEDLSFPAGEWPPRPPAAELNPDQEGPVELPPPPGEIPWRPFAQALEVDCDLPPGMELPPECREDDDRPPGSDPLPEEPTPTPTPEEPPAPLGPPLKIRYFETSPDGERLLFQSTGACTPVPRR